MSSIARRFILQSTLGVALIAFTFVFTVAAFAETTLERARAQGVIRIGFANEAPFGYMTPDGKLTGESPEVAKAVLAKLGIPRVEGVLTEIGALIPGLKSGRFDIIAAGLYITPQRCKEIAFSEPSYGLGQAILVKKGNPKGIVDYSTFKDNPALKLTVQAGSVDIGYAKGAGVSQDQLVVLPDQSGLLAAVESGRADGAGSPALATAEMAKKGEGVESTTPFGEIAGKSVKGHGGFGFRKEDTDLVEAFNKQLKAFIGTPEHIALVTPFGFGKDYLPNKTTEQLCDGK
jgi:polar amino acid transport system substrate-binding protein